jgi:hypothetical protein
MSSLTFDTLKYADALESAGFSREQAKLQASALSDVFDVNLKELATKGDLAHLEQRIDAKLTLLEQRMTIKLGTMIAAALGVGLALAKMIW